MMLQDHTLSSTDLMTEQAAIDQHTLQSLLEHACQGVLARYRASLQMTPVEAGSTLTPTGALADPEALQTLIAAWRARYHPAGEWPACVSQWSKQYLATFVPAVLALAVCFQRSPEISLPHIRLILHQERPTALLIKGELWCVDQQACYQALMHAHFEPWIEAMAQLGGPARRVLWSNVGNLVEFSLAAQSESLDAKRALEWFLESPNLLDGRANPLHHTIRYLPSPGEGFPNPMRTKRQCCLRYRLPEQTVCTTCPRLHTMTAAERTQVQQSWRRAV
jgi:ferric iron reductase protein FhuF